MQNIIDKSMIEEKLAELEQELLDLERAMDIRTSTSQMETSLIKQADQIDCQLTRVMAKISSHHETSLKNDKYQQYRFPIAATNV